MEQPRQIEALIESAQRNVDALAVELEKTRRELARLKKGLDRAPTGRGDAPRDRRGGGPIEVSPIEEGFQRSTYRRHLLKAAGVLAALAGGAAIASPAPVFADTPVLVAYQGRLTDSNGNALNGSFSIQFALYTQQSPGGTQVWQEGQSVTVTMGLFNVLLGSNRQLLASLFAANSVLYLGITVGSDQEMTPRVVLGSAPYAALAAGVPNGSITDAEVAAAAAIAESKIAFSGTGHGHTGGADGKVIATPGIADGWVPAGETWTYASSTAFAVSSDVTTKYAVGDKLRLQQGGAFQYFYVAGLSYASATNTSTVTITGGSDYMLANTVITANAYSKMATPQGFPQWFNYATTWGGFSANPTGGVVRFQVIGHACCVDIQPEGAGASNSSSTTFTLPIASATSIILIGTGEGYDNGSHQNKPTRVVLNVGSIIAGAYPDSGGSNWTASGGKGWNGQFWYSI